MSYVEQRNKVRIEQTQARLIELISMDILKSDTTEDPRAVEIVNTLRQLMVLEAGDFVLRMFSK